MSRTIETRIPLNCGARKAWNALLAPEDYGHWGSRLRFKGTVRAGSLALLQIRLWNLWLTIPVSVQSLDGEQGVCWTGGIPGVVTGRHYFRVVQGGRSTSSLVQGEEFRGLLAPAALRLLEGQLMGVYDAFNREFAARTA